MYQATPERRRARVAVTAAVIVALGAGTALIAQSGDKNAQRGQKARAALASAKPNPSDTRRYVAERNIVKDKGTGQYRKPSPAETAALVAELKTMLSPATDDLRATPVAGGGMQIGANGRFSEVVLARPAADGTMETRCVSSLEEAAAFLGLRLESGTAPADADVAAQ